MPMGSTGSEYHNDGSNHFIAWQTADGESGRILYSAYAACMCDSNSDKICVHDGEQPDELSFIQGGQTDTSGENL